MILWLHDLLHRNSDLLGFRIQNFALFMSIICSIFYIFKIITIPISIWFFIIPVTLIFTGLLNSPYCYLKNIIQLKFTSKIFKKSIFIHYNSYEEHGDLSLGRNNDGAIGIIVEDLIYLDDCGDLVLWGMKDKIRYFPDFSEFVREEINTTDNSETIKRKIILKNLTP